MKSPFHDYPPIIASIAAPGAEAAIEFYKSAFGAIERYRLVDSSSGKIGHCELSLNGGMIMVSEENLDWNKSPKTLGGTTVKFILMVDSADDAFGKAVAAGATSLMPVSDQFYGYRSGTVRDPSSYEWLLQHLVEEVSPEEMQRRWDAMGSKCDPIT